MSEVPPNPYSTPDPNDPNAQGGAPPPPPPGPPGYTPDPGQAAPGYGAPPPPGYQPEGAPPPPPAPGYQPPGYQPGGSPSFTPAPPPGGPAPYPGPGQSYSPGGYAGTTDSGERTNGLALTALITGIVGLCLPIVGLVALITGLMGLGKIKKGEGKGKGLAVTGVILGALGMIGGIVLGVLLVTGVVKLGEAVEDAVATWSPTIETPTVTPTDDETDDPWTGSGSGIPGAYTLDQNIPLGTCFDVYSSKFDFSDARRVDCETPHALEIISTFTWSRAPVNQSDPIIDDQITTCWHDVLAPMVQGNEKWYNDSNVDIWYPSARQINQGDNTGYCVLRPEDETDLLVGSLIAGTFQGVP